MSKTLVLVVLVSLVLLLAGCASIMTSTKQKITFQSTPGGATVDVTDAMGIGYGSCDTPCELTLKRKKEYKVSISKPGYETMQMTLEKGSNGWIWGNLFFGSLIGLIIDFSNGAAYKLSPKEMNVTLASTATSLNAEPFNTPDNLVIIDFETLTPEEQARVSKLEPLVLQDGKLVIE